MWIVFGTKSTKIGWYKRTTRTPKNSNSQRHTMSPLWQKKRALRCRLSYDDGIFTHENARRVINQHRKSVCIWRICTFGVEIIVILNFNGSIVSWSDTMINRFLSYHSASLQSNTLLMDSGATRSAPQSSTIIEFLLKDLLVIQNYHLTFVDMKTIHRIR